MLKRRGERWGEEPSARGSTGTHKCPGRPIDRDQVFFPCRPGLLERHGLLARSLLRCHVRCHKGTTFSFRRRLSWVPWTRPGLSWLLTPKAPLRWHLFLQEAPKLGSMDKTRSLVASRFFHTLFMGIHGFSWAPLVNPPTMCSLFLFFRFLFPTSCHLLHCYG